MRNLILFLLLAVPAFAQDVLVNWSLQRSTVTSVNSVTVPTPDFHHSFDNDGGVGVTATADQGDNCTLTDTSWVSDDAGGFALSFNGSTSHAGCGTALDGANDGAMGACIQAAGYGSSSGFGHIVNKVNDTIISWALHMNDFGGTGDRFEFRVGSNVPAYDRFLAPVDSMDACVGTTTWCHVAVIFSGCTAMGCWATVYLDGVAQTTTPVDVSGTRPSDAGHTVNIGFYPNVGNAFNGLIDEVKVWVTDVPDAAEMAADAAACIARNP